MEPAVQLRWDAPELRLEDPELQTIALAMAAAVGEVARMSQEAAEVTTLTVSVSRRPRGSDWATARSLHVQTDSKEPEEAECSKRSCATHVDHYGLIAQNAVRIVSSRPVLSSPLTTACSSRLRKALTVLAILASVLSRLFVHEEAHTPRSELQAGGSVPLVVSRPRWPVLVFHTVSLWFMLFLLLHETPRAVLALTMRSFDAMVISVNGFVRGFAVVYNAKLANEHAKVMGPIEVYAYALTYAFSVAWIGVFVANTDALTFNFSRRMKLCVTAMLCLGYSYVYLDTRFKSESWVPVETCLWVYCATPQAIATTALANTTIFLIKIWYTQATKGALAVVHTNFYDSRMHNPRYDSVVHAVKGAVRARTCALQLGMAGDRGPTSVASSAAQAPDEPPPWQTAPCEYTL